MMRWLWLIVSAAGAPLAAQAPMIDSFALVDTARLRHHIDRLADEVMIRRSTPSPGLETAAQYIADEFRTIGLRPGGDTVSGDPSWIQRYQIPGQLQLDYAASRVDVRVKSRQSQPARRGPSVSQTLDFSRALRPASRVFRVQKPTWFTVPQVVLVAGRHTPASIRKADLRNKIVLHVPASDADAETRQAVIDALLTLDGGLIIVADEDSVTFDQRRRAALQLPVRLIDEYLVGTIDTIGWAVYAWAEAMAGVLGDAGIDLARVRADTGQIIATLPAFSHISIQAAGVIDTARTRTAPNVVGILDGTDPKLSKETVVVTARLDHAGNGLGAGDNAAGIAGLIELARAFSHPAARPRRRLVFIATSGGASEPFWGATFFLESKRETFWFASKRGARIVTNINVDLAGRDMADSVMIDGLADLVFRVRPDWIAAMHPELGLTVIDGGSVAQPRSDHFAFVRRGIPSLFVHHQNDSQGEKRMGADATSNARIFNFLFHLARDLANADQSLQWNAAGRRRWLGAIGQ